MIALPLLLSAPYPKAMHKLQLAQIKWWKADEKSQQDDTVHKNATFIDIRWHNSLMIPQATPLVFLKSTDKKINKWQPVTSCLIVLSNKCLTKPVKSYSSASRVDHYYYVGVSWHLFRKRDGVLGDTWMMNKAV